MRERSSELFFALWWTFIALAIIASLTLGGLAIQRYTLPQWLGIQRVAVQESKSFVDSTNSNLANLKTEYARLNIKIKENSELEAVAAYRSQQSMVIEQMCIIMSTMDKATVDRSITAFISEHGGC